MVPFISGWGTTQLSKCQYQSLGSERFIDVLGFFGDGVSIEKSYDVPVNADIFEFSFTLVRTDWNPISDMLFVEIGETG